MSCEGSKARGVLNKFAEVWFVSHDQLRFRSSAGPSADLPGLRWSENCTGKRGPSLFSDNLRRLLEGLETIHSTAITSRPWALGDLRLFLLPPFDASGILGSSW